MKKLTIVATPIGNLGDMSTRAIEVLRDCDVIMAEDSRRFANLASRFDIKDKKIIPFHQHTYDEKVARILSELEGEVCYVSDAGTPNIADPGGKLIREAVRQGYEISAIPGASALTFIVSVSPWNTKEFVFTGFLPKKGTENYLKRFAELKMPIFFLDSPYRIRRNMTLVKSLFPESEIIIGRELTKVFEEVIISPVADLDIESLPEKGEYIVGLQLHVTLR